MDRPSPRLVAIATLAVFVLVGPGREYLLDAIGLDHGGYRGLGDFLWRHYSWYWIPAVVLTAALLGPGRVPSALGLAANPLRAAAVGAVATLPMFVGYALHGELTRTPSLFTMAMRYAVLPGVMEEVLYRGMLFGLLFRFANWGFHPAAGVGAIMFGTAHLWQGDTPTEALGVFAITAFGAMWFAWLYVEWGMNLWVPIALHVLMNFAWDLFGMGESALGGGAANAWRFATLGLSVALTVAYARRRGGLVVRGRRWWRGPAAGAARD